jgi:hypothetical protein
LGGCERVHYETYTFEWASSESKGLDVEVVTTGTSHVDSSGALTERIGTPYRIGVYFYPHTTRIEPVQLSRIAFLGESGAVINIAPKPFQGLGDGSQTAVAVAPNVHLPFEDYTVELDLRVRDGTGERILRVSGRLKKKYSKRGAFRTLEELQA